MIKTVTVINHKNESLKMDLARPELNGFVVKDISGLGPAKGTINMVDFAVGDGSSYNTARVSSRNLVLALAFMEIPHIRKKSDGTSIRTIKSIEELRYESYRYFPLKKLVKIIIETDFKTVETEGYVESNETDIFSNSAGTQISIICPDSYLYSTEIFNEPLIISGSTASKTITYNSYVDVGATFKFTCNGTITSFYWENLDTQERITFSPTLTITPGYTIVVKTEAGKKDSFMTYPYPSTSLYNFLQFYSYGLSTGWPKLINGDNRIELSATGVSITQAWVEYKTAYEGV